jgi:hypothetical protein
MSKPQNLHECFAMTHKWNNKNDAKRYCQRNQMLNDASFAEIHPNKGDKLPCHALGNPSCKEVIMRSLALLQCQIISNTNEQTN